MVYTFILYALLALGLELELLGGVLVSGRERQQLVLLGRDARLQIAELGRP